MEKGRDPARVGFLGNPETGAVEDNLISDLGAKVVASSGRRAGRNLDGESIDQWIIKVTEVQRRSAAPKVARLVIRTSEVPIHHGSLEHAWIEHGSHENRKGISHHGHAKARLEPGSAQCIHDLILGWIAAGRQSNNQLMALLPPKSGAQMPACRLHSSKKSRARRFLPSTALA